MLETEEVISGDTMVNFAGKPAITPIVDNFNDLDSSIERLKKLKMNTVYPRHGKPFPMELFIKRPDNSSCLPHQVLHKRHHNKVLCVSSAMSKALGSPTSGCSRPQ